MIDTLPLMKVDHTMSNSGTLTKGGAPATLTRRAAIAQAKTIQTMSNALQEIEAFKVSLIKRLLSECTAEQQAFFNRIFKSADEVPKDKIETAILLCERTIAKNKAS